MEPRPHERGKSIWPNCTTWTWARLQWSHVLTNVERTEAAALIASETLASMEPRPHERGKAELIQLPASIKKLQWSHVLTNVERSGNSKAFPVSGKLQWSHVLTNVERRHCDREAD